MLPFYRICFLCLALFLTLSTTFAQSPNPATTRYVSTTGTNTDPASATSWATSTSSLQGAINSLSATEGEVWIAAGTYKPTSNTADQTASFAMKNGVTIYGGFVGDELDLSQRPPMNPVEGLHSKTILSGDIDGDGTPNRNSWHVFSNTGLNNTAVLNGVVITGGYAYGGSVGRRRGGGMANEGGSSPTLTNCTFLSNSAVAYGGALSNGGNTVVMTNCMFEGNYSGEFGGAIATLGSSTLVITNCTLQSNTAVGAGGAMSLFSGDVKMTNCLIRNNHSNDVGGVSYNLGLSLSLNNCLLRANSATNRGGVFFNESSARPTLTNCTLQSNSVAGGGGLLYNADNPVVITNSVLWSNDPGSGSTFQNGGSSSVTARYTLFDPTVTGYTSDPTNLTTTVSPFVSTTSAQLRLGSVAINAGNPTTTTATLGIATDLAGNPRIVSGSIDMGAYEFQEPSCNTTVYVTPTGAGTLDGSSWANAIDGNSLANALETVCSSTTFLVAAGLYKPTVSSSRTDGFYIPSGIQVYGGYEAGTANRTTYPSSTTFSGDIDNDGILNNGNSYHVVRFSDASIQTRLDGIVITGGEADGMNDDSYGGGIRNTGGNPVLTNLVITGNRALISGGGMYNLNSGQGTAEYPLLSNVTFSSNTATGNTGGGLFNHGNGGLPCSPVLENVTFDANVANSAGGMSVFAQSTVCNPILKRVLFSNNRSNNGGGALLSGAVYRNTNTVLINCSFTNNQGSSGGAIYSGAVNGNTSTLSLTNCSFVNNRATTGGDLFTLGSANSPARVSMTNCVLFGNGANAIVNNGASLSATYSLFEPTSVTGTGIDISGPGNLTTTVSPFASTTSTELNTCSPAIDAGDPTTTSATVGTVDLATNPRFFISAGSPTGRIDMGAYEFEGSSLWVSIVDETLVEGSVCPGGSANPSVSVSGAVISYQWYNNGTAVAGQTTAELSLTNVQQEDAGNYVVVVTGSCNSVTSTVFTITVNPEVTAVINPGSSTLTCLSPTLTLTAVGATAGGPLSYRWDDTSTDMTRIVSEAGTYSVIVTTANGCTASSSVRIERENTYSAGVSLMASSSAVCEGGTISVPATVTGSVSSYQWFKDGAALPANKQPQLALANVVPSQSGIYVLVVTGACGSATSTAFNLTVKPAPVVSLVLLNNRTVLQAQSGVLYERLIVVDRVNGYEIRQVDSNTTGFFTVSRLGPFRMTVTGANGCKTVVESSTDTL